MTHCVLHTTGQAEATLAQHVPHTYTAPVKKCAIIKATEICSYNKTIVASVVMACTTTNLYWSVELTGSQLSICGLNVVTVESLQWEFSIAQKHTLKS